MANFFCWTLKVGEENACNWYRVMVPFMSLRDMGYAEVYEDDDRGNAQESHLALMHSDIGHVYNVVGENVLHKIRAVKRMKPGRRETPDGIVDVYPPAMIWDCDDNTDFVHPFNMTYVHMGVRAYPDGRLLAPGDGLDIKNAEDKIIARWVDGVTKYEGITFDIARNLYNMKLRHTIMREADGITVSSSMLAKYAREVIGCKNVHVYYNSIDPSHYENIRAIRHDKRVRVLWAGGQSHLIDWYPLRDALKAVCEKYKDQFTFIVFGEYFDWINDVVPPSMLEVHPWVKYPAFRLKRGLLNVDINLCPLVNNIFNSCKSAIKWYESAIWPDMPECTLAQRGPVFNEIEDGKTGMLFSTPEEFAQKLGLLIENSELRARLHDGAHKWVLENRTPKQTTPGLFEFYAETRARQKRELGAPIIKPASHEEIMKLATPLR